MEPVNRLRCCRLCLCSVAVLVDIFKEDSHGFSVKEVIKDLIQIEVNEESELPWFICPTCLGNLGNFRLFKLQCLESNDAYTYRFHPHETTQEYVCLPNNISVQVEASNYDTTYDQQNPMNFREEIGDEILSGFAPKDGSHEEISDGTTKFKTEVEDFEETPECTTDNVDWPVNLERDNSNGCEDNIDIEEMDISRIKGEPTEFVQTVWPGELNISNESETKNKKQSESDMLGFSETTLLTIPMEKVCMIQNNMGGKGCSYSLESIEEGRKEGLSLTSEEERTHHSNDSGKHVREGNNNPGDRVNAMTTRSMRRHCKDKNSTPDTLQSSGPYPVVDCSWKDCQKIQKNQSIVVRKKTSVTSSGRCVNNDVGKSLKGKQSLKNVCTHLITEEPVPYNHARLRPRKEIKKLYVCQSSDEEIDEEVFACDICRKWFYHKISLKSHLMSHNAITICEVCGKQFNSKHLLSKHVCKPHLELSGVGPNVQYHPRSLSESSCLPTVCDSQKPFECGICGKGFYRCESLEEHIWTHTGPKKYACTNCNKRYNSRSGLLTHCDAVHGESSIMYTCEVCDKKFSLSHFKRHQRSHWKEKMFKCNDCGNSFTEKWHLKTHMRVHTGDRPFKCMFCSKDFAQSSNLKDHLRVHSGEKPFSCPKCGQCFSHSRSMTRHLVNHKGLRPYQCQVCGRKFAEKHKLKRHSGIHQRGRKKQK